VTNIQAELSAFENTLRGCGVPFYEDPERGNPASEPAEFDPQLWPETSVEELRAWSNWPGPRSEKARGGTALFFAGFWKAPPFSEIRHLPESLSATGLPLQEERIAKQEAKRRYSVGSPNRAPNPWWYLADDGERGLIYNLERSSVYSHVNFGGQFFELRPFPELVALWHDLVRTRMWFDSEKERWRPTGVYDRLDPVWEAAGIVCDGSH